MQRGALRLVSCLWALSMASCAGPPALEAGEANWVADSDTALALRRRAEGFYLRLAHRRFDTLETYNDAIMRDHFQTLGLFFDYYADLAQGFTEAHFEKSRPHSVEVLEFLFDSPTDARVLVRFDGEDGRPLRPGSQRLLRRDRWEWSGDTWWVHPGRL